MKLNQIIAIEKGLKSQALGALTKIKNITEKDSLFEGMSKKFDAIREDGDTFPDESVKVQLTASDVINDIKRSLSDYLDVTHRKDVSNCSAKASLKLGAFEIKDIPVTYLLFLEKELTNVRTVVERIPTLDDSIRWEKDDLTNLFVSEPSKTQRTAKIQEPLVLYPATEQHPAQTGMITKDVIIGHWTTIKQSGSLPKPEKKKLLEKIDGLLNQVKIAREEANGSEACPEIKVSEKIFDYLFN
jgi:hypothetical protein